MITGLLRKGGLCLFALCINPVTAASSAQNGSVGLRVEVAKAERLPVGQATQVIGQVAAFRKATVAAEAGGRVIARLAEPGTVAKQEQLLIELDSSRSTLELQRSQAMATARKVDLDHARHELARGRNLYRKKVISQDTLDDLGFAERGARAQLEAAQVAVATAKKMVTDAQVLAPFSGQIETVHVQVGDYVNPGQPVATITDFSAARIIAGVSASAVTLLTAGQMATVLFDDLGGLRVPATVTSVGRVRDVVSGTYPVELNITHEEAINLREGLVATVLWSDISPARGEIPLSIPASALLRNAGVISAYVVKRDTAHLKQLRIGTSDGQRVEVIEGLALNDEVVTRGQFALREGAKVQVTNSTQAQQADKRKP
ncbi:MAG: efflux RND transporter periplasmic adaptor subunit [Pseudomonadota bacterium]